MDSKMAYNFGIVAALLVSLAVVSGGYQQLPFEDGASNSELFTFPQQADIVKRSLMHLDPVLRNFWIRVGECPESTDGGKQYYCPSLSSNDRLVCIEDYQLCDGVKHCPEAEDENKHYCLFYRALKSQVQLLERSVTTLNSKSMNMKTPVRRYSSSFGRTIRDYE